MKYEGDDKISKPFIDNTNFDFQVHKLGHKLAYFIRRVPPLRAQVHSFLPVFLISLTQLTNREYNAGASSQSIPGNAHISHFSVHSFEPYFHHRSVYPDSFLLSEFLQTCPRSFQTYRPSRNYRQTNWLRCRVVSGSLSSPCRVTNSLPFSLASCWSSSALVG